MEKKLMNLLECVGACLVLCPYDALRQHAHAFRADLEKSAQRCGLDEERVHKIGTLWKFGGGTSGNSSEHDGRRELAEVLCALEKVLFGIDWMPKVNFEALVDIHFYNGIPLARKKANWKLRKDVTLNLAVPF